MAREVWVLAALCACGRFNFEQRDDAPAAAAHCPALAVTVGHSHTCAIDPASEVWCWGYNELGQSAPDRTDRNILQAARIGLPGPAVEVEAGRDVTCAKLEDGSLWCWGDNTSSELGMPPSGAHGPVRAPITDPVTTFAVGAAAICATRASDRAVVCWGENKHDELGILRTTPSSATPVLVAGTAGTTRIVFGHRHVCAINDAGAVKCWGRGSSGQLGDGMKLSGPTAVTVAGLAAPAMGLGLAARETCVLEQSGDVRCFGRNEENLLLTGDFVDQASAGSPQVRGAVDVQLDRSGACARLQNGTVACWGAYDPLRGNLPAPVILPLAGVTQLAMKYQHTCAIAGGDLTCWGGDLEGELGRGTRDIVPTPTLVPVTGITHIDGSNERVCATSATGVMCWGKELVGDGTTQIAPSPVAIATGLTTVEGISVGLTHSCAWGGGAGRCWGHNHFGQVGAGARTVDEPTPRMLAIGGVTRVEGGGFTTYVTTASSLVALGRNLNGALGNNTITGDSLTPVPVTGFTQPLTSSGGQLHACAIEGGALKCWGDNTAAQLGDGTTTSRLVPVPIAVPNPIDVVTGYQHTCALSMDGTLRCWGAGTRGQLGRGDRSSANSPGLVPLPGVARIYAHESSTCAVLTTGEAYCWGDNAYGGIGDGTQGKDVLGPVRVPALDNADEIVPGMCARRGSSVSCWGSHRQLADGDISRYEPAPPIAFCTR